jgi:hypothetical protein
VQTVHLSAGPGRYVARDASQLDIAIGVWDRSLGV